MLQVSAEERRAGTQEQKTDVSRGELAQSRVLGAAGNTGAVLGSSSVPRPCPILCHRVLLNKGCVPFLGLMMVFYGTGQAQIPQEAAVWVFLCCGQPQSVQHREAIPKPLLMI